MDVDPTRPDPVEPPDGATHAAAVAATPPAAGAIVVYSNLACPRAYPVVEALLGARDANGLDSTLGVVHRPLPREAILFDESADDPWAHAVAEARSAYPDVDWAETGPPPRVSTRVAQEAVQAAKAESAEASVELDRFLRRSYFLDHLDISDPPLVLDLAVSAIGLDRAALRDEIVSGRAGADVRHFAARAPVERVVVSPTLVAFDGSAFVDPEVEDIEGLVLRSASAVAAE